MTDNKILLGGGGFPYWFRANFQINVKSSISEVWGSDEFLDNYFFDMQFQWLVNDEIVYEKEVGPEEDMTDDNGNFEVPISIMPPNRAYKLRQRLNIYYPGRRDINFNYFLDDREWTWNVIGGDLEEVYADGFSLKNDFQTTSGIARPGVQWNFGLLYGGLPHSNEICVEYPHGDGKQLSVYTHEPVTLVTTKPSFTVENQICRLQYAIIPSVIDQLLPDLIIQDEDGYENTYTPQNWICDHSNITFFR